MFFKLRYFASEAILAEFHNRFHFLKGGIKALELGAGDGRWSRFMVKKSVDVIAVDEVPMEIEGVKLVQGDIFETTTLAKIQEALDLHPVDLVISQLHFPASNDRDLDNLKMTAYNKQALFIASKTLKTGGAMIVKAINGVPDRLNQRLFALHFKDFYKLKPTTVEINEHVHYFLGAGYKLRPEFVQFPKFFQLILNNEHQLREEDIPPAYQTNAERDLEVLNFLEYVSKNQIAITEDYITEVKNHPRFKTLNWDKYTFNFVAGPLTDYQQSMILQAQYNGELSFTSKANRTYEDVQKECMEEMEKIEKGLQQQDTSNSLLEDGETLGSSDLNEMIKKMRESSKQMDIESIKVTPEDLEKFEDYSQNAIDSFITENYPKSSPKEILQAEVNKGNITKDEIEDYYNMQDDLIHQKVDEDWSHYLTRKAEKSLHGMEKEKRNSYYKEKKSQKTRRQ